MTTLAFDRRMDAVPLEVRVDVVVKLRSPAGGLVALRTIVPERLGVHVIFIMTTETPLAFELELAARMTRAALDDLMEAGQGESSVPVMVKNQRLEVDPSRVALGAVLTEFALMYVPVTGEALRLKTGVLHCISAFVARPESCGPVTSVARHDGVRTLQLETGHVVVELARAVTALHVASLAIFETELSTVSLLMSVTVRAVHRLDAFIPAV